MHISCSAACGLTKLDYDHNMQQHYLVLQMYYPHSSPPFFGTMH
ncbi:unnamed protein product [Amoebophrya sp. A25]|nr:unnamed protein product [Amoebophrya sp. A25]|eukprot:GSA25T00012274001.1